MNAYYAFNLNEKKKTNKKFGYWINKRIFKTPGAHTHIVWFSHIDAFHNAAIHLFSQLVRVILSHFENNSISFMIITKHIKTQAVSIASMRNILCGSFDLFISPVLFEFKCDTELSNEYIYLCAYIVWSRYKRHVRNTWDSLGRKYSLATNAIYLRYTLLLLHPCIFIRRFFMFAEESPQFTANCELI